MVALSLRLMLRLPITSVKTRKERATETIMDQCASERNLSFSSDGVNYAQKNIVVNHKDYSLLS